MALQSSSSQSHAPAVVVTGASSGIGLATALLLYQQGYRVFATIRKSDDAEAFRQGGSGGIQPIVVDVTDDERIARATGEIAEQLDGQGLFGLVNNAGIAIVGPLELLEVDQIRAQFEVNVFGCLAMTQAMLPLIRKGRGRIINIGSISGRLSVPFMGAYAATKFALEAVTDALRRELSTWDIPVSVISPGSVGTGMYPKSIDAARAFEQRLSDSQRNDYGRQIQQAYALADRHSADAIPPDQVAAFVLRALTARRPRTRYYVGRQARTIRFLLQFLPDRAVDWIIQRELAHSHGGLRRGADDG